MTTDRLKGPSAQDIFARRQIERDVEQLLADRLQRAGCWIKELDGERIAEISCPLDQAGVCNTSLGPMNLSELAAEIARLTEEC